MQLNPVESTEFKVVLVTGGFDPIHSGHLDYLEAASKLGDRLIVGVNSDEWLIRKKGRFFLPLEERVRIMQSLRGVFEVITFDDNDDTARDAIRKTRHNWPRHKTIFANGGDRDKENILEMLEAGPMVEFAFGVGGTQKRNSSSWILEEWKAPKTERPWGYYRVLHEVHNIVKVKELTINPGQSLSMQKHHHRAELWFVAEGQAEVSSMLDSGYKMPVVRLLKDMHYIIPVAEWHQLSNPYTAPCRIVEIQYGEKCIEEDIERKSS